jgi:protein associated with RNAse G/E
MDITKRDAAGMALLTYMGEVAEGDARHVVMRATWQHGQRDLGYVVFDPADRFTEYFYADQWFNIMRIGTAANGTLKGWYCNITRPAQITAAGVAYDDLLLDVWVGADGVCLVLDEDEFAAAALDDATCAGARAGLAEVLRWAREHSGPFAELG